MTLTVVTVINVMRRTAIKTDKHTKTDAHVPVFTSRGCCSFLSGSQNEKTSHKVVTRKSISADCIHEKRRGIKMRCNKTKSIFWGGIFGFLKAFMTLLTNEL